MATTKSKQRPQDDTYLSLISRFALKPIKTDVQHEQAVEIISELIGHDLDSGSGDYLDTLILLVNKYEDEHHQPSGKFKSPQDALRAIMSANGLSQADLGRIIGSESALSMFLKGQRGLSKSHIKALVSRFRIDASLFL